ncbi:helix-turn-helix transcriptional regulator [Herbiconiux moechotypicola]|uniref:Helix-turn-helix transcriptional regulator n=1 Tax=Herbiconiux moechotypicola TaxID=637393 RepID=A0ABN3E4I8_9MICO|nr:helix-turn-helix transcriptional regulator [Herbiconiux moechotypicola]MCS5731841.1 helix-turn-helix transcriptional regulator [Herbiconiux moechotypicola]
MESTEFGRAVRRWRDRLAPASVGLPDGGRRRATGLRREELAALTGISADYLTRLEQGRAVSPSSQVVEALARALRLGDHDRALLFQLAGLVPPGPELVPRRIPPSVQRLLDRFDGTPVAVFDAALTLVDANRPYELLLGVDRQARGLERNAVWRNLMGPGTRVVMTDEERDSFHASQVAQLRWAVTRYPADRELGRLVRELTAASTRFARLWNTVEIADATEPGRSKLIDHPTVGRIRLDCDTLVVTADDLRILVYTAEPGTRDSDLLALALVVGTQSLVD